MADITSSRRYQTLAGCGVLLIGAGLAAGALTIPSTAGYAGVGPNFLPWIVAIVLMVCGAMLVWEARSGGYREMEEPSGAAHGDWRAIAFILPVVMYSANSL